MSRRILVLGSGKRVQQAALPALWRMRSDYELEGIFARTAKTVSSEDRTYEVEAIDSLTRSRLESIDVVFMAVAKKAVPGVLERLRRLGAGHLTLFIDTPVLLFKHMGFLERLEAFGAVSVAEDCSTLPCWDPLHDLVRSGQLGDIRSVCLDRSAYAYHGLAMAKTVLGPVRLTKGTRSRTDTGHIRRISCRGGSRIVILEERDYRVGRIRVEGTRASLSDEAEARGALPFEPVIESGQCVGFRAGEFESRLTQRECELIGQPLDGASPPLGVTAWMEGMKRVGFLRLLERLAQRRAAYPLEEAIDDTVVDYHLEKFGRYVSNPITHPRHAPARALMRVASRAFGGARRTDSSQIR